ncbi:MAG: sensor domain-containing diguanylate cyclase [Candidatus Eremiobacteraeota bacterium]|nr:sensor domain-containing diguanylate cyclase [Candidatus Eremiobacteraeota bacterium]
MGFASPLLMILSGALVVCVVVASVLFRRQLIAWRARSLSAEKRLAALSQIAPPLTEAAINSTELACERIVSRFSALLKADLALCFLVVDGRLRLAAKSDVGYAAYLRQGDAYEGQSILSWSRSHARAALLGPNATPLPADIGITDLTTTVDASAAPVVGSRDRVWALALPLFAHRGHGLAPSVIGLIYAERKKDAPFTVDDLHDAQMVSRLAGDALQRSRFADEVRRDAEIDPLTQLLSAAAFRKRLRRELETRRHAAPGEQLALALFFIDTDNFKHWNDTYGHNVGDAILKRLARIFEDVARSGGFAGRNGGDEFCIALFDRSKDDAIAVAERLCDAVEQCQAVPSDVLPYPATAVTISIGVAHFPVDVARTASAPSDALLEAADARMYEAKRAGRNQVAYARVRALPTKVRYPGEGPIPRR